MKSYYLAYYFGVWHKCSIIAAESDAEAIFDADSIVKKASDKLEYALFCGNRKVKQYSERNWANYKK